MTTYTYPVYKAFLRFIYTDCIDLTPEQALGGYTRTVHKFTLFIIILSVFFTKLSVIC